MKNTTYLPPEEFATSPLLALLPASGRIAELEAIKASLYARYEKVTAIKRNLTENTTGEPSGVPSRVRAEEDMLRHVLEWLAVKLD